MGKQQKSKTSKNISYPWENFMHSKDEPKFQKKKMEKNKTKTTLENYTCTHCHKGV